MLLPSVNYFMNRFRFCLRHNIIVFGRGNIIHKSAYSNGIILRFKLGTGLAPRHYLNSRRKDILRPNQLVSMFSSDISNEDIDPVLYETICEETLDSLCEFFEDIIDQTPDLKTADVSLGDGVLTVSLAKFGTYVINRQLPNKQIWLSSPTSGPKRYDFVRSRNGWVYRHDNRTLHSLLQDELSSLLKLSIDLSGCAYSGSVKQ